MALPSLRCCSLRTSLSFGSSHPDDQAKDRAYEHSGLDEPQDLRLQVNNLDDALLAIAIDHLDVVRAGLHFECAGVVRSELVHGDPCYRGRCEIAGDNCLGGIVSCWHSAIVVGDASVRPTDPRLDPSCSLRSTAESMGDDGSQIKQED